MQQNKENKLSTRFGERPLKVVKRVGSEAVVETDDGKQYRRNTAHLRKFTHNASVGNTNNDIKLSENDSSISSENITNEELSEDDDMHDHSPKDKVEVVTQNTESTTRSGRIARVPAKYNDFVLK